MAGGPFFSVPACVTLCRCRPLCRGVHGRIADGFCALERSVRTVGCFTDGHGRGRGGSAFPGMQQRQRRRLSARGRGSVTGSRHDLRNIDHPAVRSRPGPYGRSSPPASCLAASARCSAPSAGSADLGARDAPFRPAPTADLRCTFHVPGSCRRSAYPSAAGPISPGLSRTRRLGKRLIRVAGRAERRFRAANISLACLLRRAPSGSRDALPRPCPLRTVRATRRGTRLKQAARALRVEAVAVPVSCAGGLAARAGRMRVPGGSGHHGGVRAARGG